MPEHAYPTTTPEAVLVELRGYGCAFGELDSATMIDILHRYHAYRNYGAAGDWGCRLAATELAVYICTSAEDYGRLSLYREVYHVNR